MTAHALAALDVHLFKTVRGLLPEHFGLFVTGDAENSFDCLPLEFSQRRFFFAAFEGAATSTREERFGIIYIDVERRGERKSVPHTGGSSD